MPKDKIIETQSKSYIAELENYVDLVDAEVERGQGHLPGQQSGLRRGQHGRQGIWLPGILGELYSATC